MGLRCKHMGHTFIFPGKRYYGRPIDYVKPLKLSIWIGRCSIVKVLRTVFTLRLLVSSAQFMRTNFDAYFHAQVLYFDDWVIYCRLPFRIKILRPLSLEQDFRDFSSDFWDLKNFRPDFRDFESDF